VWPLGIDFHCSNLEQWKCSTVEHREGVDMNQELGKAEPDVVAWFKARHRESAARIVAAERLTGAVGALRSEGYSIRQIASALDVPQTRVVRALAQHGVVTEAYRPVEGSIGAGILPIGSDMEAYWAAHNAAWSHLPAAQGNGEFAVSGRPSSVLVKSDDSNARPLGE